MNIAEDVLRAKKDFDDVYDAGYEKGKAEGGTSKAEQEKSVTITENGIHLQGRDFVKEKFLPIANYWINTSITEIEAGTYKDETGTITV